jgi:hypothetical protein
MLLKLVFVVVKLFDRLTTAGLRLGKEKTKGEQTYKRAKMRGGINMKM